MSDNKRMIVKRCCEEADCGVPDPGELAFDYVYEAYQEGVNYARDGEDYPEEELIENQIPYNNYKIVTIWGELQLYNNDYFGDKNNNFIEQFQYMLYEVTEVFIDKGRYDSMAIRAKGRR
tara:strand:- start:115 stop:474 length:360 start_codon:yes stop_codon:yes gene_type:complete